MAKIAPGLNYNTTFGNGWSASPTRLMGWSQQLLRLHLNKGVGEVFAMAKITPYLTSQHFVFFLGFSIVNIMSKIIFVMQFVGTFHNFILDGEESLLKEVNEAICLSYDLKIVQKIFYVKFLIQFFLLMIWFFFLVVERQTIIYLFALKDESLIVMKCSWINKKHTTLKKELWNRLLGMLRRRYCLYSILVVFSLCDIWIRHLFYIFHPIRRIIGAGFWFNSQDFTI